MRLHRIVVGLVAVGATLALGSGGAAAAPLATVSPTAAVARPALVTVGSARPALAVGSVGRPSYIDRRCMIKGRVLCIDKTRDKLYYLKGGRVLKKMDARFGCASTRTRMGVFHVFRKRQYTVSSLYHTPMPYSMFFSGGQAVHYSSDFAARGYRGCSHGCVNIRAKAKLRWVFHRIHLGDRVVVYRS